MPWVMNRRYVHFWIPKLTIYCNKQTSYKNCIVNRFFFTFRLVGHALQDFRYHVREGVLRT